MTFTLQELHDEIENDPQSLGYKEAGGEWKGDQIIADLINDPAHEANILRRTILPSEIFESIDVLEWEALPEARRQYISVITKGQIVNANEQPIFDGLNLVFSNAAAPNTRANILGKIQIADGSRAMELWGDEVFITARDVGYAANL